MSATVRVYVNSRSIDVASGGTALDAVRVLDPTLADAVAAGERALTDSRGLPLAATAAVFGGAIIRVVSNRQREQADGQF
jgi:hypothetical protein